MDFVGMNKPLNGITPMKNAFEKWKKFKNLLLPESVAYFLLDIQTGSYHFHSSYFCQKCWHPKRASLFDSRSWIIKRPLLVFYLFIFRFFVSLASCVYRLKRKWQTVTPLQAGSGNRQLSPSYACSLGTAFQAASIFPPEDCQKPR